MVPGLSSNDPGSLAVVPIRALHEGHRERIAEHLLSLDADDRYLRFGYPATDEQVRRYVDSLDFERDDIFGIFNRKLELIAIAHLAYMHTPEAPNCGEFGVSVLKKARGRGFGQRLFDKLERFGGETDAYLRLPPATLDTRMVEMVNEQVAQTDYRLKQQAKTFWDFLMGVQEVRRGVREGRHKSGQ